MKDCRSTFGLLLVFIIGFFFALSANVPHPKLLEKLKKGKLPNPTTYKAEANCIKRALMLWAFFRMEAIAKAVLILLKEHSTRWPSW